MKKLINKTPEPIENTKIIGYSICVTVDVNGQEERFNFKSKSPLDCREFAKSFGDKLIRYTIEDLETNKYATWEKGKGIVGGYLDAERH